MVNFDSLLSPTARAHLRSDEAAMHAMYAMSDIELGVRLLAMAREARRVLGLPRPDHDHQYAGPALLWHIVPVLAADLIAAADGPAQLAGSMPASCYTASATETADQSIRSRTTDPGRNLRTWIDWYNAAGALSRAAHTEPGSGCQAVRLLARAAVHGSPMAIAVDRLFPPSPLTRRGAGWSYGDCADRVREPMALRNRADPGYVPVLTWSPACDFRTRPYCIENEAAKALLAEIGPLDHLDVRGFRSAARSRDSVAAEIYLGRDVVRISRDDGGSYLVTLQRPNFDPHGNSRWEVVLRANPRTMGMVRAHLQSLPAAPAIEPHERWYALGTGASSPVYRYASAEAVTRQIQQNADHGSGPAIHAVAVNEEQVPVYALRGEEPRTPAPVFSVDFEAQAPNKEQPTGRLLEFPAFGPG